LSVELRCSQSTSVSDCEANTAVHLFDLYYDETNERAKTEKKGQHCVEQGKQVLNKISKYYPLQKSRSKTRLFKRSIMEHYGIHALLAM